VRIFVLLGKLPNWTFPFVSGTSRCTVVRSEDRPTDEQASKLVPDENSRETTVPVVAGMLAMRRSVIPTIITSSAESLIPHDAKIRLVPSSATSIALIYG